MIWHLKQKLKVSKKDSSIYESSFEILVLKGRLDSILSHSPSVKIRIMGGKVCLRCKGKILLGVVNKLMNFKSILTTPSNVLPITSSTLSRQQFEFSMKVKVMGSNPGYLLKYFLLLTLH
jgi:hypothetical protein